MDEAFVAAYGWNDIVLGHGFHETKQGIRFTISEAARREELDRLLALNHQRYAEVAAGLHDKENINPRTGALRKSSRREATQGASPQPNLFAAPQPGLFDAPPGSNDPFITLLAWLQAHPGLHGKEAILAATGLPANRWMTTINALLAAGQSGRAAGRTARGQVPVSRTNPELTAVVPGV